MTLPGLLVQKGLDDYNMIGCINFVRAEVAAGRDPRPAVMAAELGPKAPWAGDRYLQPVMAEDPLLFHDWQDEAQPSATAETPGCAPLPDCSVRCLAAL